MVRLAERLQIEPVIGATPALGDDVVHLGRSSHSRQPPALSAERLLCQHGIADALPPCIVASLCGGAPLALVRAVVGLLVGGAASACSEGGAAGVRAGPERTREHGVSMGTGGSLSWGLRPFVLSQMG